MKKVLLVSLLAIAGVSISAQNLIKNEKFATEVTNNRLGADWRCQVSERDENR